MNIRQNKGETFTKGDSLQLRGLLRSKKSVPGKSVDMNKQSGVTLIALIITIIVLLILAAITLTVLLGDNGLFKKADEAAFKTEIKALQEKAYLYIADKQLDDIQTLNASHVNAGQENLVNLGYIISAEGGTLDTILSNVKDRYKNQIVIYEGEFYYIDSKTEEDKEKVQWCRDVDVKIWDSYYREIDLGDTKIKIDPINWTNGNVTVWVEQWPENSVLNEIKIGVGDWEEYTAEIEVQVNNTVYVRSKNALGKYGDNVGSIEIANIDKLAPNEFDLNIIEVTSNSIKVGGSTTDKEATEEYGKSGIWKHQYKLDSGTWQDSDTFTGLTQGITYTVNMRVIDVAGNITEASNNGYSVTTEEIDTLGTNIGIDSTPKTWTNQDVTVTINYPNYAGASTLRKEYSTNNGSTWSTYTNAFTVPNNCTVLARFIDTTNQTSSSKSYEIANIDKTPPTVPTVNLNGYTSGNWTNGNVTQSFSSSDTQSGINRYQYSHDAANWADCPNPWLINFDGQWNFYIRAIDNAGNISGTSGMYTIRRDATPPNAFTPTVSSITQNSFRINASTTDSGSGMGTYYYYVNGVHRGTTATTYLDITGLTRGTVYSVYVVAMDTVGNTMISTIVNTQTNSEDISNMVTISVVSHGGDGYAACRLIVNGPWVLESISELILWCDGEQILGFFASDGVKITFNTSKVGVYYVTLKGPDGLYYRTPSISI